MSDWIDPWPELPEGKADNRRNRVAMFHIGRAGSSVLSGMLRQHPVETIYWEGEIFGRREAGHYTCFQVEDPLDLITFRSRRCASVLYGFETKVFPGQDLRALDTGYGLEQYVAFLRRNDFEKMILLERRNILEQIVSFIIGYRTGKWHYVPEDVLDVNPVELDVHNVSIGDRSSDLVSVIRQMESVTNEMKSLLPKDALLLTYEDDVLPDPQIGYNRIARFLGLPERSVKIRFVKGNTLPLRERLSNFEEVQSAVSGTTYEWMTD
jgi:hypothetical protein